MEAVIVFVPTANRSPLPIHAPRVGCDLGAGASLVGGYMFQFTHPVWGATTMLVLGMLCLWSFNSRTPCGVRLTRISSLIVRRSFNSRTPCGVRHDSPKTDGETSGFQFTHPVWGATPKRWRWLLRWRCFNSRTPCGVRREDTVDDANNGGVSIHAPRVGCDL